jgi:hypothetical protein
VVGGPRPLPAPPPSHGAFWPARDHGTAAPRAAQGKGGIPTGPGPAAEGIGRGPPGF